MNFIELFKNMTAEDAQRYVRIGLQWLAATLVTWGTISPTATWVQPTIGVLVGLSSLLWTLYGTRLNAKLFEVAKLPNTVIVTDAKIADAIPAANVISNTGTIVVTGEGAANAIPMSNVVSSTANKVVTK